MDLFPYDNGLPHERVNQYAQGSKFAAEYNDFFAEYGYFCLILVLMEN